MNETTPTRRSVSVGGEQWLEKEIPCLNHGFVRLVDYMGSDSAVVQAARVSYGKGTKQVSEDEGLIRYLMRHLHTTPFEMVEFKFHCKMPIFVARQWIRHRTANVNEYSGRYSEIKDETYKPDPSVIATQDLSNKQGRGTTLSPTDGATFLAMLDMSYETSREVYEQGLAMNVAKELARISLPVATYTEWYWKIDLHNLFHFLNLRLDAHAQYEIRVYAEAMAQIVKDTVPLCWKAFEDYRRNALTLSDPEIEFLKKYQRLMPFESHTVLQETLNAHFQKSKREAEEFRAKLIRLGLVLE